MANVIAIATNENITLHFNGDSIVVNRKKSPEIFEEILGKITQKKPDHTWLETNFLSIKEKLENRSNGLLSVEDNVVVIKGTTIPAPALLVKKLQELEKEAKPIEPLIRFWQHLAKNPSENSRRDLYEFMVKNNIPITEQGFIVVEKGVNQRRGSFVGDLVDCHSGTVNNSVGQTVVMDRDKVNPDSSQTCSYGLHVGAPDYVRKVWSSDVILECIVNPRDVVSVPKDYNATKMRVCQYMVMGYSDKTRTGSQVVKLGDFLSEPLPEMQERMEEVATQEADENVTVNEEVISESTENFSESMEAGSNVDVAKLIEGMSGRQIIDYVQETTGELITFSPKSKKSIVKKAKTLLEAHFVKNTLIEHAEEEGVILEADVMKEAVVEVDTSKVLSTKDMGKADLIQFAKEKFNEKIGIFRSRNSVMTKVIDFARAAGYTIQDDSYIAPVDTTHVRGNRTQAQIDRQIEGLENMRTNLPEYSTFGDPNWAKIDAQLSVLRNYDVDINDFAEGDWDEMDEENQIYRAVEEVENWLYEESNYEEDLFE